MTTGAWTSLEFAFTSANPEEYVDEGVNDDGNPFREFQVRWFVHRFIFLLPCFASFVVIGKLPSCPALPYPALPCLAALDVLPGSDLSHLERVDGMGSRWCWLHSLVETE